MGKQWKQCQTLFFGAPKSLQMVTADMKLKDVCSLEEKLYSQPRQHIKKQRHYFDNKGPSSQSYVFPRIDAFEMWCWRRLLRVPWIARRSNQSILKEINPQYSLEGLMLKLKLQYFGHLMQRTDSLEKPLMLGKIEGRRRRGWGWDGWMTSSTRQTWVCASSRSWWWTEESDTSERLNWTELG